MTTNPFQGANEAIPILMVKAIVIAAILAIYPISSAIAGPCDLVLEWSNRNLTDCIEDLKSQLFVLRLENSGLNANICVLALELKMLGKDTKELTEVADDACAEARARAANRKRKPPAKK